MSAEAATSAAGPVDPVGSDLARILRALKLSGLKDTLPERLVTARTHKLGHAAFLELLLADELNRRESRSAALRAARAGLDASMRLETWNDAGDLTYDRMLFSDQSNLAFAEAGLRPAPGPRRRRKNTPRHRPRACGHPPADGRAVLARRQALHPAARRPAGQLTGS